MQFGSWGHFPSILEHDFEYYIKSYNKELTTDVRIPNLEKGSPQSFELNYFLNLIFPSCRVP